MWIVSVLEELLWFVVTESKFKEIYQSFLLTISMFQTDLRIE